MDLYANRKGHKDFIRQAFNDFTSKPCHVYLAAPFFTDPTSLLEMADKGCVVKLVVRLAYPTNPEALKSISTAVSIQTRYVTDQSFHSKLYIFGDHAALVGSANLTGSALTTNQEILLEIPSNDPRFDTLNAIYASYWNQAKALTSEDIATYRTIFYRRSQQAVMINDIDRDIENKIGRVVIDNVDWGLPKTTGSAAFIDDFRRAYQEFVYAYKIVESVYLENGQRKELEQAIPLRLEIDSFISFVRDHYAGGTTWAETKLLTGEKQKGMIKQHVLDWFQADYGYFEDTIVKRSYPTISKVFSSRESILNADDDTLMEGLAVLHSFLERRRFFRGGFSTLRAIFLADNKPNKIRKSLSYLLFGKGDIVKRMADLYYDDRYRLSQFGRSNIQELVGWCNNEGLPVVNGRTTKVMRYFGFEITQL